MSAPMAADDIFLLNKGCPLCARLPSEAITEIHYRDTAEANRNLPDVRGSLYRCVECGIAFPSHQYTPAAFPLLYSKSLGDHEYFDQTMLQKLRVAYLRAILRNRHRAWSWSQFLDHASLHVLQAPFLSREPRDMRVLDVGCGLGGFMGIFRDLGNQVVGTRSCPRWSSASSRPGLPARSWNRCRCRRRRTNDFDAGRILSRQPHAESSSAAGAGEISWSVRVSLREASIFQAVSARRLYMLDRERFHGLATRFGLEPVVRDLQPTQRPVARSLRMSAVCAASLASTHRKPYVLAYNLRMSNAASIRLAA